MTTFVTKEAYTYKWTAAVPIDDDRCGATVDRAMDSNQSLRHPTVEQLSHDGDKSSALDHWSIGEDHDLTLHAYMLVCPSSSSQGVWPTPFFSPFFLPLFFCLLLVEVYYK